MQKLISAAYKMLASSVSPQSGCSPLAQAVQADAVQRMQAAAQRLLVQANIGALPDCHAFLQECHLSITLAYRIEQEYKAKAPSKAAAKSIRLVRSCIRAWISAFKRFAKLMCLEHLKLKVHAVDRKGSYVVSVEEKEVTDAAGSVLTNRRSRPSPMTRRLICRPISLTPRSQRPPKPRCGTISVLPHHTRPCRPKRLWRRRMFAPPAALPVMRRRHPSGVFASSASAQRRIRRLRPGSRRMDRLAVH